MLDGLTNAKSAWEYAGDFAEAGFATLVTVWLTAGYVLAPIGVPQDTFELLVIAFVIAGGVAGSVELVSAHDLSNYAIIFFVSFICIGYLIFLFQISSVSSDGVRMVLNLVAPSIGNIVAYMLIFKHDIRVFKSQHPPPRS